MRVKLKENSKSMDYLKLKKKKNMNQMWKKENWMAAFKIYRVILWNKEKERKKEKKK